MAKKYMVNQGFVQFEDIDKPHTFSDKCQKCFWRRGRVCMFSTCIMESTQNLALSFELINPIQTLNRKRQTDYTLTFALLDEHT